MHISAEFSIGDVYMNRKTIEAKYNKQIEVLKKLNEYLKRAVPVLEKFNGKIINVKIERALKEIFHDAPNLYIKVKHSNRCLTISNWDKYYNIYSDYGDRVSTNLVSYYENHIILSDTERLDINITKDLIEENIKRNNKEIERYKTMLKQHDDVLNAYKEVLKVMTEFKNKYDATLRSDTDCNFRYIF